MRKLKTFFLLSFVVTAIGCTKSQPSSSAPLTAEQLSQKGKSVYLTNCIACHGADPKLDGPIGPAVAGASRELLEARIVSATYPSGYKPKRTTNVMPAQPQLKGEVEALTAYLGSL